MPGLLEPGTGHRTGDRWLTSDEEDVCVDDLVAHYRGYYLQAPL